MTELAERPAIGDAAPSTAGVGRRVARRTDLALVRELFAESRDELLLLPSDTRDVIIDMRLRACRRSSGLTESGQGESRHEVVTVHGQAVGHVLTTSDPMMTTVVDIAVRSHLRGRGLGSHLLAESTADADRAARHMRARVRHDNVAALSFFAHRGFDSVGTSAGYCQLLRSPQGWQRGV